MPVPDSSAGKESTCNAGDPSSVPALGRSPGERIGYPLQYSCFPGGSTGKESACNVGDLGLIPGLGRSPGEGKGYPLQYSGLENSTDCIVLGVAKSRTQLSDFTFPGGSDGKEAACNAGDPGSIPGLGRYPREGNGYLLQYSCLQNSMDRGAWQATVHGGCTESDMSE